MINRTHAPTAALNCEMRTKLRIFCHCVISVTLAFLCISVNVNGEAFQDIEKIENETNHYQLIPQNTSIKKNSSKGVSHFIQPFTEEKGPNTLMRVRMSKKCRLINIKHH